MGLVLLSDRTQCVVINKESSQHKDVRNEIPEGSMLVSLLFVIFINDLTEQVKSDIFLSVDDTKILRNIKEPNDHSILYNDVGAMIKWAHYGQLEFHLDKCVTMSINSKQGSNRTFRINEIELKQVQNQKGIRVTVDHQLKFQSHMYEKNQECVV